MVKSESIVEDPKDRHNNSPVVSVVIRSYNRKEMLRRAIESVLKQTFSDFELIVADDGSTDGSQEYVRSIADDRVRLVAFETNQGGSASGNLGFKAARGEWVANLDSDDIWYEDKLKLQMEAVHRSGDELGVVFTAAESCDESTGNVTPGSPVWPDRQPFQGLVSRELGINFSSVLMRKKYLDQVGGFDEEMPRGMDKDVLIRLARISEFTCVDELLTRSYVNHGPHLSGSSARTVIYKEALVKKYRKWADVPAKVISQEYISLAIHYSRTGRHGLAIKKQLQAIRSTPASFKSWVGLALLIPAVVTFGKVTR